MTTRRQFTTVVCAGRDGGIDIAPVDRRGGGYARVYIHEGKVYCCGLCYRMTLVRPKQEMACR